MTADESRLWTDYHRDRSVRARNRLADWHMPLVRKIAEAIHGKLPGCVEVEDLVSDGFFGLLDCIERFDPSRGAQFGTFATRRIHGSIMDGLRKTDWMPRLARSRIKLGSEREIFMYDDRGMRVLADRAASPDRDMNDQEQFRQLIQCLTRDERTALILYYAEGLTMVEIAQAMGVSQGRISQLRIEALRYLKWSMQPA